MTSRTLSISTSIVIILFIMASSIFLNFQNFAYAQDAQLEDQDILILMVNLQRIRVQILLTQDSLANGDIELAFAHAYIPHSVTFPSIKKLLEEVNAEAAKKLETLLTDLPINIRAKNGSYVDLGNDLQAINNHLSDISNQVIGSNQTDKGIALQSITYLLKDTGQSYVIWNSSQSKNSQQILDQDPKSNDINYENALGLVNMSRSNYAKVTDLIDERRKIELDSFFSRLQGLILQKADQNSVSKLIAAIERDINEELAVGIDNSNDIIEIKKYFPEIKRLLSGVIMEVRDNGNYQTADSNAVQAYLDNYEYLEAPLERIDPNLMAEIEVEMREELRNMLAEKESPAKIVVFVNGIVGKLDRAEELLRRDRSLDIRSTGTNVSSQRSLADIELLSQGFGVYTGERKDMGEAGDPAKAAVRSDIDEIRAKLDQMLLLYKERNYEGALLTSRSAYLDSYEKVEIPLRPINPDFTLEMEIKFAELRNLIQSKAPYESVAQKTTEIRRGLGESERLVSGTGILAPTIAFSTSFSIIFREGLESALIIGAIITYLEASRNERFKKHVYLGIVIAAVATGITWFVAQYIIELSGASRELIEAIAGISAVAVLFWVSFWVLNRIETKKWIEFVKAKVWQATTAGSVTVFVLLSFFTVYREGFETVLFYQAMLSYAKYMEWYVVAGLILGLAVIVGVALVVKKLGKKLPLRVLFGLTMGIGAYMSIAFLGNAIREFQEVGYIPTTPILGIIPRLDINLATMTGIHPTLESIIGQLILLSIYVVGSIYVLILQPRKKKAIESSRKSMAGFKKQETEGS